MIEIRSLENVGIESVLDAFHEAFADYSIDFRRDELKEMLRRRGFDPRLSFAAFDCDGIVSFTFNGIGRYDNIPTAYDTGTGTKKDYRGRGLAGKIMSYALPRLKEAGIDRYLLEVLSDNAPAIKVYKGMGFDVSREFVCYSQNVSDVRRGALLPDDYEICEVEVSDALGVKCTMMPSWQNSDESLLRGKSVLTALGAFDKSAGKMVGCVVSDPATGDISRIAVDEKYRRRGIASALLEKILPKILIERIKVLNIDEKDSGMRGFLEAMNIAEASRQYEMIRPTENMV